ncbi:MAG: hypothetical protein CBB71_06000 [Rhodopirellula sp. TMED11]|nr:MAG: hypothetical protein CBB71_06000 [Rhodopirellula sp. TMED11]
MQLGSVAAAPSLDLSSSSETSGQIPRPGRDKISAPNCWPGSLIIAQVVRSTFLTTRVVESGASYRACSC